ncbi:hypothetical protein BS78_03G012900 [Paspalum vaginatum]|nr:hypothetical protein BS78_03G012900 [Paspalum vaginatum]KAJ1281958.1 hypothetical protein BS78_03G012900 [Paspalum vaginatum]
MTQASTPVDADEEIFNFILGGPSASDMPLSKENMMDVICDYIMIIDDPDTLNTSWMRSFQPYEICVTVRELQGIVKTNKPLSRECFNLGVQIQAYTDYSKLKRAYKNIVKHYIDLQFCASTAFGAPSSVCKEPTDQELGKSIERWPYMNHNAIKCATFSFC